MKYLLDTANLENIQSCLNIFPVAGVTSNPSIVKREGKVNFFEHMRQIRSMIGMDLALHIQVTARNTEGMIKDAYRILSEVDNNVFIKIPVTMEGLPAIHQLKKEGIRVTGTAIYSSQQGFLAMEAGADCIAPYFNRMENMGINPDQVITSLASMIRLYHYPTEVLAASFKNAGQVDRVFLAGAQTATLDPAILTGTLTMSHITSAVDAFDHDWSSVYGSKTIAEL